MQVHRPIADRRRQLVDAGLTIAEREGAEAVTVRRVADEAAVSLGLVYHCFAAKDELLIAMATQLATELADASAVAAGVSRMAVTSDPSDIAAVLHAALHGLWAQVERTPGRQLLTYEITTRSLRAPWPGVAQQQYSVTIALATQVLLKAAETAQVTWTRDLDEVAGLAVMAIDGATLRWLVDRDSDAALARLGDIADLLTTMTA